MGTFWISRKGGILEKGRYDPPYLLCSDRLVVIANGLLKPPNLHVLLKQKSLSLPRNLALRTFGELLIVFSAKVNMLYLPYSVGWRCCLLHLTKQIYFLDTFL